MEKRHKSDLLFFLMAVIGFMPVKTKCQQPVLNCLDIGPNIQCYDRLYPNTACPISYNSGSTVPALTTCPPRNCTEFQAGSQCSCSTTNGGLYLDATDTNCINFSRGTPANCACLADCAALGAKCSSSNVDSNFDSSCWMYTSQCYVDCTLSGKQCRPFTANLISIVSPELYSDTNCPITHGGTCQYPPTTTTEATTTTTVETTTEPETTTLTTTTTKYAPKHSHVNYPPLPFYSYREIETLNDLKY